MIVCNTQIHSVPAKLVLAGYPAGCTEATEWLETNGILETHKNSFLAVSRGQKQPPLASPSQATHLIWFLCSAERGRFFVPA